MKITVFTSNQPRHMSLIASLAEYSDTVFAVQECTTIFPGEVADFYQKSPVMQQYFAQVLASEDEVFGSLRFLPPNARSLSVKMGDLSKISLSVLSPALKADIYIIFGSSFIRGSLCDFLVDHGAINIHMGVSPYFRGSSCNFWALHDGRPDLVGATIHRLSKGLDSGPMLFHALPKAEMLNGFLLGMRAVKAAHLGLVQHLKNGGIADLIPEAQDKRKEIRYSRANAFTDEVVSAYLPVAPTPETIMTSLRTRDPGNYLRPFFA